MLYCLVQTYHSVYNFTKSNLLSDVYSLHLEIAYLGAFTSRLKLVQIVDWFRKVQCRQRNIVNASKGTSLHFTISCICTPHIFNATLHCILQVWICLGR